MKCLLILLLAAASFAAQAATIIQPLPNNIQNGQPADATRLMGNFNQIVTNVNSNAAALTSANVFTAPQQFAAGTTPNQGVIVSQVQSDSTVWLGIFTGTANDLTATAYPAPSAYASGNRWKGVAASTNTGAMTLNLNGLGMRAITKFGGSPIAAGDIVAGQIIILQDDGARLQLLNPRMPVGIPYVDAGGTGDAITAAYTLYNSNLTIVDGMDLTVGMGTATNTTTSVTFTPTLNATLGATWGVVKFVGTSEVPLAVGDIRGDIWLKADVPNSKWILMNPQSVSATSGTFTGTVTLPTSLNGLLTATSGVISGTAANALVKFTAITTTTGSFTPQVATKSMVVICIGGGGNGGAGGGNGGGGGGGGGAGQVSIGTISPVTGTYVATVGGAGGGTTSFGGVITALGGAVGTQGVNNGVNSPMTFNFGGSGGGGGAGGAFYGGGSGATYGQNGTVGSGGFGGVATGGPGVGGGGGGGGGVPAVMYMGSAGGGGAAGLNVGAGGGFASSNSGAGGGGGGGGAATSAGGGPGGSGGSGVILVWEYQ